MTYFKRSKNESLEAVLFDRQGLMLWPGGGSVPAGVRSVRGGDILARNTSTKKFIVVKSSFLTALVAANATVVNVNDAHPFEVGDSIVVGTATAETITAINYVTHQITLGTSISKAVANKTAVKVITNGQGKGVAVALLPVRDKDAAILEEKDDVTPRLSDTLYGTIALKGRFKYDKMKNFDTTVTGSLHTDLAGVLQDDINVDDAGTAQGLYMMDSIPEGFND